METGALLSDDRVYRYALWRRWNEDLGMVAFIGLNPSTADETEDDPTIRRCIGFAKDWGYGGIYMLNLFAFRATDPKAIKKSGAPIGPDNGEHLIRYCRKSEQIIAAWGTHGEYLDRGAVVKAVLASCFQRLWCLGETKAGHPRHPLYLAKSTEREYFAGVP